MWVSSLLLCAAQQLRPQRDSPIPGPRKDSYVPSIDGRVNDVFPVGIIVKIALENLVKESEEYQSYSLLFLGNYFIIFLFGVSPTPNERFFLKDFIYLYLERGEGRERNTNVCLTLPWPPLGTWPHNPGMCSTWNRTGDPLVRSQCSIHSATPARAKWEIW